MSESNLSLSSSILLLAAITLHDVERCNCSRGVALSREPGPHTQFKSQFDLIGDAEGIVDLGAELANRAFELGVPDSNRTVLKLRVFL